MAKKTKSDKNKKLQKRGRKMAVVMLASVTTVVWLLFLFGKMAIARTTGHPISFMTILDGIFDNILGILPPIIIFNFAFEYLTQDYVSDEISEQITSTLMSNPDTIKLFENDTKRNFLNATVAALAVQGEDESSMAIHSIEPYIQSRYNLRKYFRYNITLRDYPSGLIFSDPAYMLVTERLKYTKQYIASDILGSSFKIGFFIENKELDKYLRRQEFLMRESFIVNEEDYKKLLSLSEQDQRRFIEKEMALKVFIDRVPSPITGIEISDIGIVVSFESSHDQSDNEVSIDIAFSMPQLKKNATFLVSITEPTFSPSISLSYPRQSYEVVMYPFFSDVSDALVEEIDHGAGTCDISIQEKWVYPMSGIVFNIRELNK